MRASEPYLVAREGDLVAERFLVCDLIGIGGMGSVWAAVDQTTGHDVVLKFHEDGFLRGDGGRALRRFIREAEVLQSVAHPNVCGLIDSGQDGRSGERYLVLERLRGETLDFVLSRRGPLPAGAAFAIAHDLANGLAAVHAAGVLHRDVKPSNILLHQVDGRLVPKLIDFGLARLASPQLAITLENSTVGTPGYMAPEQARGRTDLDGRIDVYGLGVTLYEMLCGALPARGETNVDLLVACATRDPIPLRSRLPSIEPMVEEVVMQALKRNREERFGCASSFAMALGALRDPQPLAL